VDVKEYKRKKTTASDSEEKCPKPLVVDWFLALVPKSVSSSLPPLLPGPHILSHGRSALPSATETALLHYVDRIGLSFSCATLGSSACPLAFLTWKFISSSNKETLSRIFTESQICVRFLTHVE
jgi:hypothetical protein